MKRITLLGALVFSIFSSINSYSDVFVHGYHHADGTYVQPNHQSQVGVQVKMTAKTSEKFTYSAH